MSDPDRLVEVWTRTDACEARFSSDEVSSWPEGREALLTEAGIVRRDDNAASVACDACQDGHVEDVVWIESPRGSPGRAYIHCPEAGRVSVPLNRLKQWTVDFEGLAEAVAKGMDLAGEVEEVVQARLWSLGKTTIAGTSRDVFLARGTTWVDASGVFGPCERLNASRGCLMLVPGDMPPNETWGGNPPVVVPLKAVARLGHRRLTLDRHHLESLLAKSRRRAPVRAQESFPTPPGTKWHEVMVWVTDMHMTIEVKGRRRDLTFQAAGFADRRKGGVPDKIWTLLKVFGMQGGVIPYEGADLPLTTRTNLKKYVSELRKRLQAAVPGVDEDPIPYDGAERCYRTAFKVASQDGVTFPVPCGTAWPDVTITLIRDGMIRVSVPTTEQYAASTYAKEPDGDVHQWEPAERESELEREYDLRMLGLADENGRPDAVGEALIEVLCSKGTASRPPDDDAMLGLCGVLTELMAGLDGSAFDFAPSSGKWVALFQTSCQLQ